MLGGASGLVVGIPIAESGVFAFLFFKASYTGLILLTERADNTRLQLLALAGKEYDQMVAKKQEKIAESPLDDDVQEEIYNKVVKEYNKMLGLIKIQSLLTALSLKGKLFYEMTRTTIITMVLYDGLWVRE